ncbi:carboxymuconolactone decarboxylase family protein [Plastoroseomonas hellenica]|uniref:Carboxymuconolactone decarboxylase family protein n=1 Tax=Plastoroseomonas hellenica TaxID=2687306 RepID=A0ABS5ERU6_9PROT|nr:carboxymuconolactone decarboxylase family protein [Plastoroseomonas hellenica]MBR0647453.1 carboxymuconolactone decarboxylase family protein [Plastoroseomonas hellenica]MBR0663020.1 carboxymuconolactone decarboxylase family protein [Plastoroseomonas hellenica]
MTADTRIENWDEYSAGLRDRGKDLRGLHPELVKGFVALNTGAATTRHLDAKTRELIALAVAVTTRCEGCIDSHSRKARAAGATKEEVAEALGVAIALNAGAAFTYSLHVLDAFDGAGT